MKNEMRIFSPSKINLFLAITGRRTDGYHEIFSVNFSTDFCDEISIFGGRDNDSIACDAKFLDKENNTIISAIKLFKRASGIKESFFVDIKKNIPHASGFGGGSSNGVAVLKALNSMYDDILSPDELSNLSKAIGADGPFFLTNYPAIVTGFGDIVGELCGEIVASIKKYRLWLFKPSFGVATAEAYDELRKNFRNLYIDKQEAVDRFSALRDAIIAEDTILPLFNTFSEIFFSRHKEFRNLCKNLRKIGCNAMLSGSGSGFFCLSHCRHGGDAVERMIKDFLGHDGIIRSCSLLLDG